jgi:inner membrane protein
MRWDTHVLGGINSLWLLTIIPHQSDPVVWILCVGSAGLGALLPDLDASESKIKHLGVAGVKPFTLPTLALHQALGHRGMLHSLAGLVIVSTAALPLVMCWPWPISLGLILGYASHLAVDASTRSGIPLLYPRPQRSHLMPQSLRLLTGSSLEDLLLVLFALPAALFVLRIVFP